MAVEKRCKRDFTAAGKSGCSWTSDEVRYLQRHRADGSDLIAHVLGRTTGAVQQQAHRLGVSLRIRHGETCPMCGEHIVREGTDAALHGMCQVCWERRKADAMRERAAELRAKADYEAAKKQCQHWQRQATRAGKRMK